MKILRNQDGSSHVMIFVAVAVIAVVGIVAFRVQDADAPTVTTTLPNRSANVPNAIESAADIRKAESALDTTTIDSSVNPNQLDEDINAL